VRFAAVVEQDLSHRLAVELGDPREVLLIPAALLDQPGDFGGQAVAAVLHPGVHADDRIV
jgi:hypothetical protein